LREIHVLKVIAVALILSVHATGTPDRVALAKEGVENVLEQPGRFFDLKIPEGFTLAPMDEPGIFKWKKDSGEIYLVVGDVFGDSDERVFNDLRKAANKDKRIDEVKILRVEGGKALLWKEVPAGDPGRLQVWRLIAVTKKKKMINIDFMAPVKDFRSFAPGFEEAVKSFKLR